MDISKYGINMNETKQELFFDLKIFTSFIITFLLVICISTLLRYLEISIEKWGCYLILFTIIAIIISIPYFFFAYKSEENKEIAPLTNYIGIYLILFMIFISTLIFSMINWDYYYITLITSIFIIIILSFYLLRLKIIEKDK
jgi:hypothetical protein